MRVYFDTAVLVAASVAGHPHHSQSALALESAMKKRFAGHVSGHGLSEVYAVLTRTPFSPAIYPAEAWKLVQANILPYFEIVTITPQMYRETIRKCAENGWGEGYTMLSICGVPGNKIANAFLPSTSVTSNS